MKIEENKGKKNEVADRPQAVNKWLKTNEFPDLTSDPF